MPDAWKPNAVEKGDQATSPDRATYLALETATGMTTRNLVLLMTAWS